MPTAIAPDARVLSADPRMLVYSGVCSIDYGPPRAGGIFYEALKDISDCPGFLDLRIG